MKTFTLENREDTGRKVIETYVAYVTVSDYIFGTRELPVRVCVTTSHRTGATHAWLHSVGSVDFSYIPEAALGLSSRDLPNTGWEDAAAELARYQVAHLLAR